MKPHASARLAVCTGALAILLPMVAPATYAADQTRDQIHERLRDQDHISNNQIYGSQLMTRKERNEYRRRLRAAKTLKERERIRHEHHKRMQERAKARGLKLPDEPPAHGMGGGMGPGGGMGSGRGGGRGSGGY